MSERVLDPRTGPEALANCAASIAVNAWFVLAAIGHWVFLAYILAVFFPPIAQNGLNGLKGMHLPSGFREGETLGNLLANKTCEARDCQPGEIMKYQKEEVN